MTFEDHVLLIMDGLNVDGSFYSLRISSFVYCCTTDITHKTQTLLALGETVL